MATSAFCEALANRYLKRLDKAVSGQPSSQVVIAVSVGLVVLLGSAASFWVRVHGATLAAPAAASPGLVAEAPLGKKANRRGALEAIDATVAVDADVNLIYVPKSKKR